MSGCEATLNQAHFLASTGIGLLGICCFTDSTTCAPVPAAIDEVSRTKLVTCLGTVVPSCGGS